LKQKLSNKTKIVNITHVSNVTGKIFDIKCISKIVKDYNKNIFVISDLTAAAGHIKIYASDLHIDAGYFSMHKMFGPSGVGILYVKRDLLRKMKPIFFGGGMVFEVGRKMSTYRSDVKAFEAGTNNLADVIASQEAVHYINKIGLSSIQKYNKELLEYTYSQIKEVFGGKIDIYTEKDFTNNIGILSFDIKGVHPHDVAEILARDGVAIRSGHHCAKILMDDLGLSSVCRISLHIYNTKDDIDVFINSLKNVFKTFKI
jgi:cysteine desulfurase/selenocysteine lyase